VVWPARILVVGGGTAGWLAALMLGDAARRAGQACNVTVLESSKIGTIGVGEGTTAVFRQMLKHFDLDETEFLVATGATIKFGIRHKDWRRRGHSYDGPIDDPHQVAGLGATNALDLYAVSQGDSVGQTHLFQHLLNRSRSPFAMVGDRRVPVGPDHHAYHFDQALAGKWLRSKSRAIDVIDDQVAFVKIHSQNGDLASVTLESGRVVEADLFVDCTGFRRRLISEMGARWQSYGSVLPVNRAMPFWLDIPDDEEIDPCTLAWAQGSGWMWKIPTQDRYGCGYVYSDAHLTPDQAKAEIEVALGHEVHVRNDIRIDAGRQDRQWIGNCVAVGLSSSFLEPLEATSIHGTVVQLMLLSTLLTDPNDRARTAFNAACARQVDDFRDFIRLHYVSERRDTPFWCDVAEATPVELKERLAQWAAKVPGLEDFAPFPMDLPHTGHHLHVPVLDGLGLLTPQSAKAALAQNPKLRANARRVAHSLATEYRQAAGRALGHRAFLTSLHRETVT
jgi:2-polyprenyl-6-methoxyphenol hydroxylase-like FAD-dependent oxidoreductase